MAILTLEEYDALTTQASPIASALLSNVVVQEVQLASNASKPSDEKFGPLASFSRCALGIE